MKRRKNGLPQVVSFSGGKDSTAMLHAMLEHGEPVDHVIWFDTGWEFPQMADHVALVEKQTGIEITRLQPAQPFDYWMYERQIVARKGPMLGKVHRIGNGWPSPMRRWCTRLKVNAIDNQLKEWGAPDIVVCIGFAADEAERGGRSLDDRDYEKRFPLIEYGMTEADALEYCYNLGYDWDGLYEVFHRVSCFCCPLQSLAELRNLRTYFPELWARMLEMDSRIPGHNAGFHHYDTVHDLEDRFAEEEITGKKSRPRNSRKGKPR